MSTLSLPETGVVGIAWLVGWWLMLTTPAAQTRPGGDSPPASTNQPTTVKFTIGDRVTGNYLDPDEPGVLVRSTPSILDNRYEHHRPGEQGKVIGGPRVAEGFTWWQVHFDRGLDGWSTEANLDRCARSCPPPRTRVAWDPSPMNADGTNAPTGYEIYLGKKSRIYTTTLDAGLKTTFLLPADTTGFLAVRAYIIINGQRFYSPFSPEIRIPK